MKKLLLIILVAMYSPCYAQKIDFIVLGGYGAAQTFFFNPGGSDKLFIALSKNGTVNEFGPEYPKEFSGYYPGRLQKYMGRVEYYPQTENEAYRGKLRYIGMLQLTYYGSYDDEALRGKVKSIGSTQIEYYSSYEDASLKGNIKTMGSTAITWCPSYDNEAIRGRIKSVGNTIFEWYTSFDDKAFRGKVKQIAQYPFTYFSSFENNNGQQGFLKTGFYTKYINGINYYLRN